MGLFKFRTKTTVTNNDSAPQGKAPIAKQDRLTVEVAQLDLLNSAWKLVRASGGGPGRDGVTVDDFRSQSQEQISTISRRLFTGKYRFGRLRVAAIPKPDGDKRMLGIPSVLDRIVLQAIRLTLEPRCEKQFQASCHAYRAGRGAETAFDALATAMGQGLCFVAETDIRKFFDSVRHSTVLETLQWVAPDYAASPLLRGALTISAGRWASRSGLAQGSPLSPLLANVALIEFDRQILSTGVRLIRYADDLIMLAASRREAERALLVAGKTLKEIGLELHPAKTRIVDSRSEEFDFLGFRFQPDRVSPTTENWNRLYEEIRHWCADNNSVAWSERIDRINGLMRSFAWYYQKADCGRMLWNLDHFVREQLQALEEKIGKPKPPWQERLITAHRLRDVRYLGKQKPARRWNGY